MANIDPILLTVLQITTFNGDQLLTNATGFLFERDGRLYLVSNRHVFIDEAAGHRPNRIEMEIHNNRDNLAESTQISIPLYRGETALWKQGKDTASSIDVVVIEINKSVLPEKAAYKAFGPEHLRDSTDSVEVGSSLMVVGFPLGFHDTLHHMPVVRHATVASPYGFRFQGMGYFLTDARTHRGVSGAPVVMRVRERATTLGDLPWMVLGVHSARFDVGSRDVTMDEALGLNCAWYTDIILTLTK